MQDIIEQFRSAMLDAGIRYNGDIKTDAGLQRFTIDGDKPKSLNGWYTLHTDGIPAGEFGSWKSGLSSSWCAKKSTEITPEERKAIAERAERAKKERAQMEAEKHKEAAETAAMIWEAAEPALSHPYLTRKNIQPCGARVGKWPVGDSVIENALIIPIRDGKKITSLQAIFESSNNIYGRDKTFLPGGAKKGGYFVIGSLNKNNPPEYIAITEGFATGATIHLATGWPVVIAFNANNLPEVTSKVRRLFLQAKIVICADNDQWTHEPVENPGVHYAKMAAKDNNATVAIPEFNDLSSKPTDFNDLAALQGIDSVRDAIIKTPVPESQPVRFFKILGFDRDAYYVYQYEKKQTVRMTKSDMTTTGFMEIAPLEWWIDAFPSKQGFAKDDASNWLIREAHERGIYDPSLTRGRGAWIDDGRLIFHFGDQVSIDGKLTELPSVQSRYIYEQSTALLKMPDIGLSLDEAENIFNIAGQFRWTRSASQPLLAGWIVLAPLCGMLKWRPHIWLTGGAGSGKTTIVNDYIHHLLGDVSIYAQGNSTEAGIRQTIKCDAIPVIFDESEQNNDREQSRVQNILSLIRQSSSESGAKTLKGTAGGDALNFLIRSMFCLSSIQVGIKHQADYERLTILNLVPKNQNKNAADQWHTLREQLHLLQRDKNIGARLFKRSLDMLPSILKNIELCVDICTKKFNSVREGDQLGTLLGGALALLADKTPEYEFIQSWIDTFNFDEYREHTDTDESTKALTALLESRVRSNHGDMTIFAAIEKYKFNPEDCNSILSGYGMRVQNKRLYLANNSSSLSELMKNTPYAADLKGQLLRIEGAQKEAPMKFAGYTSRAISLPLELIVD